MKILTKEAEPFHPYIHDNTLNSEYPSPELKSMADQWRKEYEERNRTLWNEYRQNHNKIKETLPASVVQFAEKSLHDAKVTSVHRPSENLFIMTLDCRGGFSYFKDIKLTFTGVKECSIPDHFQGAWWLYDEIYCTATGFELQVLFDSPLIETAIIAENVTVEELD